MALISIISRLVGGVQKNVDISVNTLVVGALSTGTNTLTDAILGRLISLQNGSDVATTYHTHDTVYTRTSALASTTGGTAGSTLIGDDNSYSNFTPSTATVKGALTAIDSALGSAASALDGTFRIKNTSDPTKQLAFSAATIATGTTRTITMPNANVDLTDVNNAILKNGSRAFTANQPLGGLKFTGLGAGTTAGDSVRYEQAILTSGANAFGADQSLGSNKLTNVSDPTSAQDAATKAYVDSLLDGRSWKQPVRVASTANINLASASDPNPIDGVTLANGDRILLKDQTAGAQNGIYVAVTATDPTTWLRSSDANASAELEGAAVFVKEGTVSHDFQFAQTADSVTLGTTPLVWVVTSANSFSGHDMVSIVGGQISVDLATVSGLESTNPGNAAGQLRVKLEASNPTLKFTGSNELAQKLDPAGAILAGASGTAVNLSSSGGLQIVTNALGIKIPAASALIANAAGLDVQVDNTTVGVSANKLFVKTAGIDTSQLAANSVTPAKLNTSVADQTTITGGGGAALAVVSAPLSKRTFVAGEAFAAGVSYAVRFALSGETAGRVYKADKDASTTAKYMAIGVALSAAGVSAGANIDVVMLGTSAQGSGDTTFNASDIGKELFVGSSGALILGSALAGTTNEAAYCIGVIQTTVSMWVDFKNLRGIA